MRRKRIHVSSGTYCKALAQLERRMMSHIALTKEERDWVVPIVLGCFLFLVFFMFAMITSQRFGRGF
jgi:hypothetical protein